MFPSPVYERGLAYYKNDQVDGLLFDINHNVWTASVHGSEVYFVEVNLTNFKKGSIRAYCDCPAFDTYDTCKHIVAVLLNVADRTAEITPELDYQATNRFITAITSTQRTEVEFLPAKAPMHVEYYCKWSYERNLYIELKTGEKRAFVVKDAYEFLENILQGNEHYFTKTFTYHPDTHYFYQRDLEVFELLYSFLRNEEIYSGHTFYHYQGSGADKRSVIVPPLLVKEILEKLIERDFTVELNERSFSHVEIVENELPFQFSISKNKSKDLMLQMDKIEESIYLDPYQLLFSQGKFYFPTKEQIPVIEQITNLGMGDHQLPILQDQADVFLSEVLPSLKKVGEVNISEKVASEVIQVPLKAKLFLEAQTEWIVGKLEYHYGNHKIDPFNPKGQSDVIIIRDVQQEQQIMSLIEYASFRYNGKDLFIEADEDELYEFLYTILPLLDQHVELFLTSEVRGFIVENEPIPSTSVRLESSTNLLEIGFNIDGVDDAEINQILNAVIEKKHYYRMKSGALLSLEGEEFSSMKQFFSDLNIDGSDVESGNITMPVYRGAQIDELIDMRKNYDPSFRKLLNRLKSPEEQVYELPENLQASLRDYQKTGYQWFKSLSTYHLGGILADDMGLGKTLQSIAYILSEPSEQPHLIVAPSSVVYNWKNECNKFAPDLDVAILTGPPIERKEKIEQSLQKDVWITSYATLRQDIDLYREIPFQTMILDEAQFIKNYATKTSQAIRQVKATRRFALSGTPIENSIDELWAIFQVILPGLMPNQRAFRQLSHERIGMITKPFILRRLKEDVLKELPDKIESTYVSELTKDQRDLYVGYLRQLQQEATDSIKEGGFNQNRMKILAGLTRLRQICCHPSLFIENYQGKSGKLEQLIETVRNSIENGKRMLIFSQFTSMHEIIIEKLQEDEIGYFYLHGGTPAEERVQMSERFNNGENSVFLISLRAGGTGLNLTGADTVILYDLWWNPAVEDQATGRAHRFGQKKVVQVFRLIAEGTIEEKIYDLQQKKRELIDQVIQPGETMLSGLSEEDIREILSI
jgi:SNF2 family DNA or RNA helicase